MLRKISWILFELVLVITGICQAQPGIPTVVSPRQACLLPANSEISFYWSFGFPLADAFELQVAADAGFTQITHAAAGLTQNKYRWPAGANAGTYFWRVKGLLQGTPGQWSPGRTFTFFDPLSLPNLQLWLRADTGLVLQGNRITQWKDLSANQYILSQSDTGKQFRINSGYSGFPFAEAFGAQLYELPSFPWQNANTGFVVGKRTGGLPYGCFFSAPNYTFDCHASLGIITNTLAGTTFVGAWNVDSLSVLTMRRIPGNSDAYKNAQLAPPQATTPIDTLNPGPLRIGDRFDGITDLTGMIGEIIICNSGLNDSLRNLTENYLMNRFEGNVHLPADTSFVNSLCPISIAIPDGIRDATWNNGSGANPIQVTQTQWISISGIDRFGRAVSDSMFIRFPEIHYPTWNSFCKDSVFEWTPVTHPSFQIQWSNGSSSPTLQVAQSGSFYATITDASGCTMITDSIPVGPDYLSHQAHLGQDTTLCRGNPLRLTPAPVPGAQYLWNTGEISETIQADSSSVYWVQAISPSGCPVNDSILITVQGEAPIVDFSFTQGCINDTIYFTDLSFPPNGSSISAWEWNLGNGQFSTLPAPTTTFPDTGWYQITLKSSEQNGCSNQIQKNIRIYKKPLAKAFFLNACERASVPFIDISLPYDASIIQWNWNFGDPSSGSNNTSILQNPTHIYDVPGNYLSMLKVSNNAGCTDSVDFMVIVEEKPTAQITYSANCPGQAFQVYSNSLPPFPHQILHNLWNDSLQSTAFPFPASAAGIHNLKLVCTSSNGCRDTLLGQIHIAPFPKPRIETTPTCLNTPIFLSDSGTCDSCTHRLYQWQWNRQNLSTLSALDTLLTQPQQAEIILALTDQRNCTGFDTLQISVEQTPQAQIVFSQEIYGAPVSLNFTRATGNVASEAFWQSNGQTMIGDEASFLYTEPGDYPLILICQSVAGCSDTALLDLRIPGARSDIALSIKGYSNSSDGYLRPVLSIRNQGNVPETNLTLMVNPGFSEPFTENIAGVLLPGDSAVINTSGTFLPKTESSNLCCAEILKSGLPLEERIDNNKACSPIDQRLEGMDELFPNPATSEVTLRIYSPQNENGELLLHDASGKLVRKWEIARITGLQTLVLDISDFAAGIYQLYLLPEGQNRRLLIKGAKGP